MSALPQELRALPENVAAATCATRRLQVRRIVWVGFILLAACAAEAAAPGTVASAPAPATPAPIQAPSLVFSLFRILGAMAVVIACFLGGVWLFRNWQRLATRGGRSPKLNVLESRSLGPRTGLYVIGYEQQRFLIASAPTGVSMLTALPPGSADELAAPAPAVAQGIDFASVFSRALSLVGKGEPRAGARSPERPCISPV